jgi:hypothetical protein
MSTLMKELCRLFQIRKMNTAAFHAQSNTSAERFNSYILQVLRAFTNEYQNDWDDILTLVLMSYRTSHATQSTKSSPYMLMFGKVCHSDTYQYASHSFNQEDTP